MAKRKRNRRRTTLPKPGEQWKHKTENSVFIIVSVGEGFVFARWNMGSTAYRWKIPEFIKRYKRA